MTNSEQLKQNLKQQFFAKVDKLAVEYIKKLSTLNRNVKDAQTVTVFANHALDNIEHSFNHVTNLQNLQNGLDNIIVDYENSLKRLYAGNLDESANADAFDKSIKQRSIVTAIAGNYNKSFSNEEVLTIYDIIEPIFTELTCSETAARRLLYMLGYSELSNEAVAIMQAIVDCAYNVDNAYNQETELMPINESAALRHVLDYGEMLVNNATYRIPAIDKTLSDIETYLEPIKQSDTKLAVQGCFDEVKTLAQNQRSSSALIASEYVKELQNRFKDWKLVTQYSAKYGTYPAKAAYQKRVEELVAAKTLIVDKLCNLLDDIAKTFHCCASYIAKKSAIGLDVLQVKFISNFMQADETVYNAIYHVLESLNFNCRLVKPDNFTCIMYIGIDTRDFQVQTPILSLDQAETVCRKLLLDKLQTLHIDGIYDVTNTITNIANAKSMKWWQLVQQFTKLLNEQASTMYLVWISLYPETRVHLLQSVNAGELYANSIEKLKNIDWLELYPETKEQLIKMIFE